MFTAIIEGVVIHLVLSALLYSVLEQWPAPVIWLLFGFQRWDTCLILRRCNARLNESVSTWSLQWLQRLLFIMQLLFILLHIVMIVLIESLWRLLKSHLSIHLFRLVSIRFEGVLLHFFFFELLLHLMLLFFPLFAIIIKPLKCITFIRLMSYSSIAS
jgi:hypothetical protein